MMIRSRTPSCSAGGIVGFVISAVVTAGPGGGWELVTGVTTRIVGAAFRRPRPVARREPASGERDGVLLLARGVDRDLGQVGLEPVLALHQTGDPDQHEPGLDRLAEGHVGGGVERAVGGG